MTMKIKCISTALEIVNILEQLQILKNRLEFARDNGCNVAILTGSSEPQQNRKFLKRFGLTNESLKSPFKCIEMQTTGVLLDDEYLKFLRNEVGVTTISLSLSALNDNVNCEFNGTAEKIKSKHQRLMQKYKKIWVYFKTIFKYDKNFRQCKKSSSIIWIMQFVGGRPSHIENFVWG